MSRIRQSEMMNASPDVIYGLLTSSEKFSAMTGGAPAEIDSSDGGSVSLFGGMITGRTIETVPGQRVVQAWRPQPWAPGIYSIVHFEISEADNGSSEVTLEHSGFPEEEVDHLTQGWVDNYWDPMRAAIAG